VHSSNLDPAFDPALDPTLELSFAPDFDDEPAAVSAAGTLDLHLRLRDAEVIEELVAIADPRERADFAAAALRIGVLSLRTARGQVDVRAVRDEVERMLLELRKGLSEHRDRVGHDVTSVLREYFDPKDGRFAERVQRLVEDDGELARVIKSHVEGSDSALAQTLARHVGADSALLRTLDPKSTDGVVAGLTRAVEESLGSQREAILGEFSLDNREGALARLVDELKSSNAEIAREFSLDDEGSALSRLVQRVERAQQQIAEEFTLDSDTSALARLRKEWLGVAAQQNETLVALQTKMEVELAKLTATRAANAKSTAHGHAFEAAVLRWLERRAGEAGDLFEETGTTTGAIKNCKVGDAVIELGPDQRAAGARIVVEAKEAGAYRLAGAREEIETARKNRGAEVGVFVLSTAVAPEGWERFRVIGSDVFVAWNAEDEASDVFLEAALAVARALCTRARQQPHSAVDLDAFERSIRAVEKQMEGLEEITRSAQTIENGAERIKERARIMGANLLRAVETLDRCFDAARQDRAAE
jgi:hypothetical protein